LLAGASNGHQTLTPRFVEKTLERIALEDDPACHRPQLPIERRHADGTVVSGVIAA